jgi:hypothetical protein
MYQYHIPSPSGLHHKGSISWYKHLSNLSSVLGLLDLELPEVELMGQHSTP